MLGGLGLLMIACMVCIMWGGRVWVLGVLGMEMGEK